MLIRINSSPRVWGIRPAEHARGGSHAVHPHVCGEYSQPLCADPISNGSSPRVWGIPCPAPNSPSTHPVHPHVCGEYGDAPHEKNFACAVHPHVCGEYLGIPARCTTGIRFIPTCVGNTP